MFSHSPAKVHNQSVLVWLHESIHFHVCYFIDKKDDLHVYYIGLNKVFVDLTMEHVLWSTRLESEDIGLLFIYIFYLFIEPPR